MTWPAQPLRSSPITGLHRYYELVRLCASHRYSPPRGRGHPGFSLSTTRGPTSPISTGHSYRDDRFSCSMPGPATSSRHLYTEHRQGHEQAAPWLRTRRQTCPCPEAGVQPRFRCHRSHFRCVSSGLHMFVFSSLTWPADREPSPQSLPTPALNRHDTAAVWDLRLHGEPGGPPSIPDTARFVLAIFYIVITPLSGRTTPGCAVWPRSITAPLEAVARILLSRKTVRFGGHFRHGQPVGGLNGNVVDERAFAQRSKRFMQQPLSRRSGTVWRGVLHLDLDLVNATIDDRWTSRSRKWSERSRGVIFCVEDEDACPGSCTVIHPDTLLKTR